MTEALAQPHPPPPKKKKEKKNWKKKLEKRGPTYSIQTVVQSTCVPHVLGHLHVASSDGLFKYEGYSKSSVMH